MIFGAFYAIRQKYERAKKKHVLVNVQRRAQTVS